MKSTARLLSLLIATMLVLAGCSSAEEAGEEMSAPSAGGLASEAGVEVPSTPAEAQEAASDIAESASGTILDLAADNPQLSQLVAAVEAAGLSDQLEQAGPITVFAPNDEAFSQLGQADLAALLADPASLGDILQYHVVEGSYTTADLTDGQTLTTMQGGSLPVTVDGDTVTVGGATVIQPDLTAGNGVLHVVDQVLQP